MKAKANTVLQSYNTFGIAAVCLYFGQVSEVGDLERHVACVSPSKTVLLGGGSNVLLPDFIPLWVLQMNIKGVDLLDDQPEHVSVRVGAGEPWHEFVLYALQNGWGGLENLSLIPGTVGASPIQNIGAYGVEVEQYVTHVHVFEWATANSLILSHEDCKFGYRDSIFKQAAKGRYCITHVDFRLPKQGTYPLVLHYGAIKQSLEKWNISAPTAKDVSKAVIMIRQSKLPDPRELGNAGSFFKNPVIPLLQYEELQARFPNIVSYPVNENEVKVPAGWLIEQCGWKGKRMGPVGCYKHQALVIVNHGGASSQDIKVFAKKIQESVANTFGIKLEREITYI